MTDLTSWGRLTRPSHRVVPLADRNRIGQAIADSRPGIAFGNGRSYGDVCLNSGGTLWQTTTLDRFIAFDPASGRLRCEAGVLLRDIQRLFVPRGWMLPVTPGTQLATVGGAIANDVHGKNHHVQGSFGDHLPRLRLLRTSGETIDCGPDEQPDWFAATVGGLGLTGVIAEATLQLRRCESPWLQAETLPFHGLAPFFALADASESGWEHTVAWVDCLYPGGRGLFMRANHVAADRGPRAPTRARAMPFTPPFSLVNRLSLRPFNAAYFHAHRLKPGRARVHYEPFFYPLDNLLEWNRMYGRRGFYQYQSVVPRDGGQEAVQAMLEAIARSGEGSFLAVLKTFGQRPAPGLLSFPRPGVTLALDFPNRGADTHRLFERLDAIVRDADGRIYPAKDARMPRDLFKAGYPRWPEFLPYRDPGIRSDLSRRLMDT